MRVLLTGGNGFVGQHLIPALADANFEITLASRRPPSLDAIETHGNRVVTVGDLTGDTDWSDALDGCRVVVHMAGQIPGHTVQEDQFHIVNNQATGRLASQAAKAGIQQFIFISSMAAITDNASTRVISDETSPAPVSAYGRSKLAGERHVANFAKGGKRGTSIRPPMIYGPNAKGSWGQLQKLAATSLPLPFGLVQNKRSALSIRNLTDAVLAVLRSDATVGNGAFALADAEPVSLAEMVECLREGMGLPRRLLPIPPSFLSGSLRLAGKSQVAGSLFGDLLIDARRFYETFDWFPGEAPRDAMRRSGKDYIASLRK